MATKLFLRDAKTNAIGVFRDLSTTAGSGVAPLGEITTIASATEIQWKNNGEVELLEWISGRAPVGGFTLSGTMTFSIWARENNMNANCGARSKVFKRTAAGVETLIGGPYNDGVEFGTAAAEMVWTGTPTSTAFAENDRLIVRYYITNIGTMAGGFVCSIDYGAADATTGDSFFQINENVTFKAEDAPAITGTMAVTESGADDFTAVGGVAVSGSVAATETGADDFTAAGGVAATGSLAASEAGADDFTADGTVTEAGVTGMLAATESGADDATANGTVAVSGTLSATESGADDATASGTVAVQGTLSATEAGADDATASGAVAIDGSLGATESGSDDFTAAGIIPVAGSLAATETGSDDFTGAGSTIAGGISGTLDATEAGADDFTGSGTVPISGNLAATEAGSDDFTATGSLGSSVSGSLSAVEAGSDDFTGSGFVAVSGAVAASEGGPDLASLFGLVLVEGSLSVAELGLDTFSGITAPVETPEARTTRAERIARSFSALESGTSSSAARQPRTTYAAKRTA
jgi:hypothetical protein